MDGTNTITLTRPVLPQTVTPHLLRQFIEGGISRDVLDKLPRFLVAQLEQIAARMRRQAFRAHKRETKAQAYRAVALAGGGAREVARRKRQLPVW